MEIETTNDFMVSVRGEQILIMAGPPRILTKAEALRLAAWLVALADDAETFPAVLAAVQNT